MKYTFLFFIILLFSACKEDTRMIAAMMNKDAKALQEALDDGANVNFTVKKTDLMGRSTSCGSALGCAVNSYRLGDSLSREMTLMILAKNPDVNLVDLNGYTPLNHAVVRKNFKAVQWLVERGADVNAQAKRSKRTPLAEALSNRDYKMAKYLLEHGTDISILTKRKELILNYATDNFDIFKLVLDKTLKKRLSINTKLLFIGLADKKNLPQVKYFLSLYEEKMTKEAYIDLAEKMIVNSHLEGLEFLVNAKKYYPKPNHQFCQMIKISRGIKDINILDYLQSLLGSFCQEKQYFPKENKTT